MFAGERGGDNSSGILPAFSLWGDPAYTTCQMRSGTTTYSTSRHQLINQRVGGGVWCCFCCSCCGCCIAEAGWRISSISANTPDLNHCRGRTTAKHSHVHKHSLVSCVTSTVTISASGPSSSSILAALVFVTHLQTQQHAQQHTQQQTAVL